MDTQICSTCHESKPGTEFYKTSLTSEKYRRSCKTCMNKASAIYAKQHPENLDEQKRNYAKKHPDRVTKAKRKWAENNVKQFEEIRKRWRDKNPNKLRFYHRKWSHANRDKRAMGKVRWRARKYHAPLNDFTAKQWREMKEHYEYKCVYCGKKQSRLSMDHITPLSKGGSHTLSNVVPACRTCNSRKGIKASLIPIQPMLL